MEQFIMKRNETRRVPFSEWPALTPGAIVKSHPELPLKSMSGLVKQQQGSVSMSIAHIITREH